MTFQTNKCEKLTTPTKIVFLCQIIMTVEWQTDTLEMIQFSSPLLSFPASGGERRGVVKVFTNVKFGDANYFLSSKYI